MEINSQSIQQKILTTQKQSMVDSVKEKGGGLLQSVFNVLRTGEFAAGGVLSGKSPLEGIKQKISPSDALGITNGFTRLAADIFLDPTTYITLGSGSGIKLATKAGKSIILTKAGTKQFKDLVLKVGADKAKKEFPQILVKNPEYIDKSGIKFMGQTIVPKSAFDNLGTAIKDTAVKVPYVNSIGKKVEEVVDIFNPLHKLSRSEELSKFAEKHNLFLKGTRAETMEAIENTAKLEKEMVKAHGKEFGKYVTKYVEEIDSLKGMPAKMADDIKAIGDKVIKLQEEIAQAELKRGILKSTLGQTAFKTLPKNVKMVVEKYTDDILSGSIRTPEELKKMLTVSEKAILKGKYSTGKVYKQIVNSKPNADNYLRHLLTEKGRKYLEKEGGYLTALPKPLRVKLQAGKTRTMRKTIEEANEAMRARVGGDFFEPDAFKSLAFRQSESIRAINTFDFLEDTRKSYGVLAGTEETSRVIDGVKYVRSTNKQLDGFLFPEPIAKQIDETLNFLSGDKSTKAFLKAYDKALSFWKGTVTGWFPAFHTRNFIGGSFNNWLANMNPKYYAQAIELQKDLNKGGNKVWIGATGETYTSKQLIDIIKKNGAINQPGMIDVMKEVEDIVGASKFKQLGNYPKVLLEAVENNLRIPLFMDRFLGRGYNAADSVKDVFKYHFDYAPEGLTAFERNWMKRIMPFYTWTRNNIPLQVEQMVKQPGKYAFFPKLQQDIGGKIGEEEFQDLPEWMQDMMVVRVGEQGGNALWLQLNLPLEDIAKLPVNANGVRELMSMMSPLLKTPVELVTNRNLFWGSDIVNPDLPKEFQTAKTIKQMSLLPQPIKDFLNIKEVQYKTMENGKTVWKERYEMDAVKLHILQAGIGRFYSTVGQMFDEDKTFVNKMTKLLGGMPVQEVDMDTQRYWNTYEKEKQEKAINIYTNKRRDIDK